MNIWTDKDDKQIGDVIIQELAAGKSLRGTVRKLGREMNKEPKHIYNRWYHVIRSQRMEEVKEAEETRQQNYIHLRDYKWLTEHEELIAQVIVEYMSSGRTQTEAIDHLTTLLPYSAERMRNRWQSKLRKQSAQEVERATEIGKRKAYKNRLEKKIEELKSEITRLQSILEECDEEIKLCNKKE
ncbi:hypothetical protein FLK61_40245 [Paenalkalicoccus suaedae]|uniref:Uncharacterized protein n=1 Tax=Paenalkalicoccus suaedae TaxID=2592382 RepID=A0A859FIE1_9BACI|nr:hypothetical protein [Paenalkalicoccus suaedae]QKS72839.1 hypothetical protein FLK61_40245 [Paenalkalicoccus suaedae]